MSEIEESETTQDHKEKHLTISECRCQVVLFPNHCLVYLTIHTENIIDGLEVITQTSSYGIEINRLLKITLFDFG